MTRRDEFDLLLATGIRLHVEEWGRDDPDKDHTVLVIHGFLDAAASFRPMIAGSLAARWHVLAPDLRGHGRSQWLRGGGYYHFPDYVADLHALIVARARRRVSLVGHSMGGSVAAYLAGAFPERFSSLALLEGLGPPEDPTPPQERVRRWVDDWSAALAREPRGMETLDEVADRLQRADPLLAREVALGLAPELAARGDDGRWRFRHDPVHQTRAPTPYREELARPFFEAIACPVLLVTGARSPFAALGEAAERRATWIRAPVTRAILEDAGHALARHRPAELGEVLARHLDAVR